MAAVGVEDMDEYSDSVYWRRSDEPSLCSRELEDTPTNMETDDDDEYNSFSFWHQRPQSPAAFGLQVECSGDDSSGDTPMPQRPSELLDVNDNATPFRLRAAREQAEQEEEEEEEEEAQVDPMDLLSGGAGARLLGLLGRLSQHLGAESRFARAAGMLHNDMRRQREAALQVQQGQEEEQPPSPFRVQPLEGSTLEHTEVMSSVGSLLTLLQTTPTSAAEPALVPRETTPNEPMLLFDVADAAMPPPSPASPESLAALSPPPSDFFRLDTDDVSAATDGAAAHPSCPICLEQITEPTGALQMPCARQHVFHSECLLKWLDARNSCPVCRHLLPEAAQPQTTAGGDDADEGLAGTVDGALPQASEAGMQTEATAAASISTTTAVASSSPRGAAVAAPVLTAPPLSMPPPSRLSVNVEPPADAHETED